MTDQPWLTIFAGPDGSGKSTLRAKIVSEGYDLGTYINADDIASAMVQLAQLKGRRAKREAFERPAFEEAEARRQQCLEAGAPFSFETVFSHPSKIEFIKLAKAHGFRVKLLIVGTESAQISIARVKKRVAEGGHDVPEDKIVARYERTMRHLRIASLLADQTYVFDNSGSFMRSVASMIRRPGEKPGFRFAPPLPAWVLAWAQAVTALLKEDGG